MQGNPFKAALNIQGLLLKVKVRFCSVASSFFFSDITVSVRSSTSPNTTAQMT